MEYGDFAGCGLLRGRSGSGCEDGIVVGHVLRRDCAECKGASFVMGCDTQVLDIMLIS